LANFAPIKELDYFLNVQVLCSAFPRGIYLRHPSEVTRREAYKVTIKPIFPDRASSDDKLDFEWRLRLNCPDTWVSCPEYLIMSQSGKTFNIEVDPRGLTEGMHVSCVKGYLEDYPDAGFLLEVPITVLKPRVIPGFQSDAAPSEDLDTQVSLGPLSLEQGERFRKFIVPPIGCTYIDAVISDSRHAPRMDGEISDSVPSDDTNPDTNHYGDASARMLVLHAVQIMRGSPYNKHEKEVYINLLPGSKHVFSWPVIGGCPMELVIARNWSSVGVSNVSCDVNLNFCGAVPEPSSVVLHGGACVSKQVRITSHLATVDCAPSGKLSKSISAIKPLFSSKVWPIGPRDVMPNGKIIYGIDINYCFEQPENLSTKPTWPGLNGVLYESAYIAQFYTVTNAVDGRVVCTGDAWPSSSKLGKGVYQVRLHVRADSAEMLRTLSDLQLLLERDLSKPINISFSATQTDAMAGTGKVGTVSLKPGTSVAYYIKEPPADQLPNFIYPGDWITGSVTYLKKADGHAGAGCRPGGFPISYTVSSGVKSIQPPLSKTGAEADAINGSSGVECPEGEESSKMAVDFNRVVKETKVDFLKGLAGKKTFMPLYSQLSAEDSTIVDFLPYQQAMLTHAEYDAKSNKTVVALENVVTSANKCISLINATEIALNLGQLVNPADKSSVKARKEAENKKAELVEALYSKASAELDLTLFHSKDKTSFDVAITELTKWDDMSSERFLRLQLAVLKNKNRYFYDLRTAMN
jgi:tripeptidyl-peptidase II